MIRNAIVCAALFSAASSVFAQDKLPSFRKIQLTDQFWSEGADYADFNHDGHMDIASGPFWYEGPDFKIRHEYRPANHSFKSTNAAGETVTIPGFEGALGEKNEYSDDFFTFTFDVNADGWPDIVNVGFPGKETFWYENPQNKEGHWKRHLILPSTDDESPAFGDLFGDGKRELICGTSNYLGYAAPADWNHPEVEWKFHRITTKSNGYHKFLHGLGFGDVNSDGRNDILIRTGWFEQPASLEGDPLWKFHPYPFAPQTKSPTWGSSQMYVYDVNGDGLPDVITCLDPHGFGLAWYEQLPGKGADGEIQFKRHLILNPDGSPNSYGVAFSEPHSVALVDIDGDGLKDIVTGKRFWAHGKHGADPQSNYPAVLYWFKLVRGPNHTAEFVPHLIDSNSGVGTEVIAGDVNGDGRPDIVVGNKKGTFVFLQQ